MDKPENFTCAVPLDTLNEIRDNGNHVPYKWVAQDFDGSVWAFRERPVRCYLTGPKRWALPLGSVGVMRIVSDSQERQNPSWEKAIQPLRYSRLTGYQIASSLTDAAFAHYSPLLITAERLKGLIKERVEAYNEHCAPMDSRFYLAQDFDGTVCLFFEKPTANLSAQGRCWFVKATEYRVLTKGLPNENWQSTCWAGHINSQGEMIFTSVHHDFKSEETLAMETPTPTAEQYRSAPFVSKLELEHDVVKKAVVEALGSANDILLNMIKATPEGDAKVPFGQHSSLSKAAIMLAHHQGYPLQVLVFDEWHDVTEFDGFNNSLVYKVLPKPVPWQKPPCPVNWNAVAPMFKWAATDIGGTTYVYEKEPTHNSNANAWGQHSGSEYASADVFAGYTPISAKDVVGHTDKLLWKRS